MPHLAAGSERTRTRRQPFLLLGALGFLRRLETATESLGVPLFALLPNPGEGEGIGRDVFRDRGARSDVGAAADSNRRDELRIASYERTVLDDRHVLLEAVVVAEDGARADVRARADDAVAEIGEVVRLRSFAERGLLRLDEVADMGPVSYTHLTLPTSDL